MADSSTSKMLASLRMKTSSNERTSSSIEKDFFALSPETNNPELSPSADFEKLLANILGPDYLNNNTIVD